MKYVLMILIFISILVASGVYAVCNRYTIAIDPRNGTVIIDTWDFTFRVIEKESNGKWLATEVIKGGPSVIEFEREQGKQSSNLNDEESIELNS